MRVATRKILLSDDEQQKNIKLNQRKDYDLFQKQSIIQFNAEITALILLQQQSRDEKQRLIVYSQTQVMQISKKNWSLGIDSASYLIFDQSIEFSIQIVKFIVNLIIQMYNRKDHDIFGTTGLTNAPRIQNNQRVDPYARFRKQTDENYEKYQAKLTNVPQAITGKPLDASNVNKNAKFEDNYHRARKQKDLQSSIFYPPTAKPINKQDENEENNPLAANKVMKQTNFGRKEVFKREVNNLHLNNIQMRGNSSRLFGIDQRINHKPVQLTPLIPHMMKWDEHDSVKYSHINSKLKDQPKRECALISESVSTVFQKQQVAKKEEKTQINKVAERNQFKKDKTKQKVKKDSQVDKIEVKILKGWDHKFMQGLSKHCKLNNSAILSFQIEEDSKATISLKKSLKWQNVVDWLRKDCKLKLRVMN